MVKNIIQQEFKITREDRRLRNGHNSFLVFFTGLSGSGKTTISCAMEEKLHNEGIKTFVLDGDNIRQGINKNLGFSPEDRSENNRRIGEIANLFVEAGLVVLAAFISPYKKDRNNIRNIVGPENFIEVYMSTDLEECERRDVKGLYKKARAGEIKNMTGISAPYEPPENPDVKLTQFNSVEESVDIIYSKIKDKLQFKR
ncbi:adenylyl-sulfate kinase [Maribacter sp. HTCC2170]|uniref:adenylyl-sulfate kinase n=1 Tax=Maribacter sp. (strain HTCC2170 / KCCM 42371) TaxID=313603 RepID=UPI00006BD213|nr:adenylyl-sulfate kinase [Maribacter sp. HTCC2170]EAR02536.1 adenylylsulfate kinase [Maribacter sp. HTCC2170]